MSPRKRGVGLFLSTPSGWRATLISESYKKDAIDFYPRPPGGGRRAKTVRPTALLYFYPRPPGGGRQASDTARPKLRYYFYPRPPGGGRPMSPSTTGIVPGFLSTPSGWRATYKSLSASPSIWNFYPRPPGGGRRMAVRRSWQRIEFLSTPSGWRATLAEAMHVLKIGISIHALRVEGDNNEFNTWKTAFISIHALRVEGDETHFDMPKQVPKISIHALRVEGDISNV